METIIGQFVGANGVMQPAALSVLASAAAKSALVLIGAWIVTLALRRGSAATRHLVWSVAIVAALALPLAGAVLPSWPVAVSVPGLAVAESGDDDASTDTGAAASVATTEGSSAAGGGAGVAESTVRGAEGAPATAAGAASETRAGTSAVLGGGVGDEAGEAATNASGPTAAVAAASGRSWGGIALFVWLGGMLVVAGGMLVGLIRVRRLSRRARPVTEGRVAARVRELSGRLGLREAPRVLRGEAEAMPMTWGVASPSVYLPMEADAWSDERLDAVLLHELAHVRRRDYPIQLAAELVCALYWFNPLAWLAARRLRVERERACDDHALFAGARPSTYAGELLELARSLRPARATASATMSMARPSQLTGRLLAVLDEGRPRRVVSRRLAASIVGAAIALVVPLATLTPTARADSPPDRAGATADDRAADDPTAGGRASADDMRAAGAEHRASDLESNSTASAATAPAASGSTDRAAAGPTDSTLPQVVAPDACWDRDPRRVGTNSNSNDDVTTLRWQTDDCQIEARIEGEVRFRGDLMGIERIGPGGSFRLEEDGRGMRRRAEVRPGGPGGELAYESWVDGDRRPFDADARAWFERTLLALLQRTGYAMEERVEWLLERGGIDAVLAEVETIGSDFVQRRYLLEMLRQTDPDERQLIRVIALAGVRLDSDFELARLLIRVADAGSMTEAVREAFIEAATSLDSDFERRRVLSAALEGGDASPRNVAALLDAARAIGSDFELAALLIQVADRFALGPEIQRSYLDAATSIRSDFEKRRVLDRLLGQDGLTVESFSEILDAAGGIGSDFELARLLKSTARHGLESPDARRSYLAAARSIGSDFELKGVLLELVERDDLDAGLLRSVLETALEIDSDFELAGLLIAIADRHRLEGELREAFLRAADTIGSDFEHGRVASALMRQERGGTP